jgi:CHASE3 domain sensor protein
MEDLISRQAAIDALDVLCQEHRYRIPGKRETYSPYNEAWQDALDRAEGAIGNLPSAQPEQHEIGYSECANAMLKMWIDNVLTDREYNRIMDKLNAHWAERREENE